MMTREEEYYRTREDRDTTEREVEELETELSSLGEDTEEWCDIFYALNDAENHAMYLNRQLEDWEGEPYYSNEY